MKQLVPFLTATMLVACSQPPQPTPPAPTMEPELVAQSAAPRSSAQAAQPTPPAELTVTTKSPEAKAAFERAMELRDAARWAEAAEQFKRAGALDPDFALAKAFEAMTTSSVAEGDKACEAALAKGEGLPAAERSAVEALVATQRNELPKALAAWRRVTELVPTDWRGHAELALLALEWLRNYELAESAARKAVELNPRAAWAFNALGYALVKQQKMDEGIAALAKAVELLPSEANPRDSLGEACLLAGRLEQAEVNFRKAVELLPSFAMAWTALAETQVLRGNWQAANESFAKAIPNAKDPYEKANVRMQAAMALLAQGKKPEALKMLDELEAEAKAASPSFHARVVADKAFVLLETGEPAKALPLLDEATKRFDALGTSSGISPVWRAYALGLKVRAQSALKKNAEAGQALAALEALAKASAHDPYVQSEAHAARASLLLATGDAKAAAAELARCLPDDPVALRTRLVALEKAGDTPAAASVREQLAKPVRHPMYLLARTKLGTPAPVATEGKQPSAQRP